MKKTKLELFFENEYCRIYWYKKINCVYYIWKLEKGSAFVRDALMEVLKLVTEKKADKWLGDHSRAGNIRDEDLQWVKEKLSPIVVNAGVKYFALVLPKENINVQQQISYAAKEVEKKSGLITHYFDNLQDADDWLNSV
jgi:hypothetical protein